ncbi:zf-HC2 domain-containing protein [Ideonella sp.]|uniref:zf-HC2 domain-containing protein n=1 Tax=Ideonella sp. TaxID=1929293 RepID=UPI002B482E25|nr:zf-HC2 domain-containing protein [Ideonella sp.]HJV69157.1 zf-HC2 domain-containing protein [Ideonella sp.]
MKWMINCKEATHLVLQGEDKALSWSDRLRLRMHLAICAACPRFVRQVAVMRMAVGRWRAYRDDADGPPGP